MASDVEVRHCRALVAIDRARGIAAAARELGVAQSTMSETLASLERVIGTPLTIRRAGREAILTPAAIALLPHAHALIATSEAALSIISGQSAGIIRLGTVESISSFLLPHPIRAFRQRWPRVDVQISIGLCENLRQRVRSFELDAAISIEGTNAITSSAPGLVNMLSPSQLELVVSTNHILGRGPVPRAVLQSQSFLLADPDGAFNSLLQQWLAGPAANPHIHSAGSIDGVKRGVIEGDVIGVLPSYAISEEVKAKKLKCLNVQEPLPGLALFFTTNHPPPWLLPLQSLFDEVSAAAAKSLS